MTNYVSRWRLTTAPPPQVGEVREVVFRGRVTEIFAGSIRLSDEESGATHWVANSNALVVSERVVEPAPEPYKPQVGHPVRWEHDEIAREGVVARITGNVARTDRGWLIGYLDKGTWKRLDGDDGPR